MHKMRSASFIAGILSLVSARDVPSYLQTFYDSVTGSDSRCDNTLADGFTSIAGEDDDFVYCGLNLNTSSSVLFLQGPPGGTLPNMDICCDGIQGSPADDGRCALSPSLSNITAFQWIVESYDTPQTDLDANIHPYIVLGNTIWHSENEGAEVDRDDWPTFDPQAYGIQPLSVMAVICKGQLLYGIWGDMNGDDGEAAMVGEASLSLATACFGDDMNGNRGYDGEDVLYLAFPGEDAVPGKRAKWDATSFEEFEESIGDIGDLLIKRLEMQEEDSDEEDEDGADGHKEEEESGEAVGSDDDESSASRTMTPPLLGLLRLLLRITR